MASADTDGEEPAKKRPEVASRSRRNFLRTSLAAAVVFMFAGIAALARSLVSPAVTPPVPGSPSPTSKASATTSLSFPRVKVASLGTLTQDKPVTFNYPLEETPNLLVKLGVKAVGGVGPDGDIVAFSQVCQHLGCIYGFVDPGTSPSCDPTFKSSKPVGYCCCHGSVYDFTDGAKVIEGPSPRPEPQVILEFDSSTGDIYATGMTPPTIFGHDTGSKDVTDDLQGGTLVS